MKNNKLLSEGLSYHVQNNVPLNESIYRPGSKSFFSMINEAREAYERGEIYLNEDDYDLIKTDIGQLAEYNGMVVALDFPILEMYTIDEAEYQGRKVKLGKPMAGDVKKFKVYVKNPKGNVVKVNFGDKKMRIKKSNPKRRRSFRARHNCDNPGPRHKARYWSCRKW